MEQQRKNTDLSPGTLLTVLDTTWLVYDHTLRFVTVSVTDERFVSLGIFTHDNRRYVWAYSLRLERVVAVVPTGLRPL